MIDFHLSSCISPLPSIIAFVSSTSVVRALTKQSMTSPIMHTDYLHRHRWCAWSFYTWCMTFQCLTFLRFATQAIQVKRTPLDTNVFRPFYIVLYFYNYNVFSHKSAPRNSLEVFSFHSWITTRCLALTNTHNDNNASQRSRLRGCITHSETNQIQKKYITFKRYKFV